MPRGVRAERWWLETGHDTLGPGWPNVLNVLNLPTFAYALYAAYTRRPVRAALATAEAVIVDGDTGPVRHGGLDPSRDRR